VALFSGWRVRHQKQSWLGLAYSTFGPFQGGTLRQKRYRRARDFAPQIRILLTIVRVYKLCLLTYLLYRGGERGDEEEKEGRGTEQGWIVTVFETDGCHCLA